MPKTAFTLLELLIVITIVAILAGAISPLFKTNRQEAQIAKAQADLEALALAGRQAYYDTGTGTAITDLYSLMDSSSEYPGWRGPYVNEVHLDPWGLPYSVVESCCYGTKAKVTYLSHGPNKTNEFGLGDDIAVDVIFRPQ